MKITVLRYKDSSSAFQALDELNALPPEERKLMAERIRRVFSEPVNLSTDEVLLRHRKRVQSFIN